MATSGVVLSGGKSINKFSKDTLHLYIRAPLYKDTFLSRWIVFLIIIMLYST